MQKIVEVVVNKPKSKMGGMGKLSQFSGIKQSPAPVDMEADRVPALDPPVEAATLANSKEKLVAVNFNRTYATGTICVKRSPRQGGLLGGTIGGL
jgi:hypothetical protein